MAVAEPTGHGWVPEDNFGARLILVRRELGLTQEQAAAACGLDDGSWSNWEKGRKPRGMDSVVRSISDALGVDLNWLMWGGPLTSNRCTSHLSSVEGTGGGFDDALFDQDSFELFYPQRPFSVLDGDRYLASG